jgi:hypothetical protein
MPSSCRLRRCGRCPKEFINRTTTSGRRRWTRTTSDYEPRRCFVISGRWKYPKRFTPAQSSAGTSRARVGTQIVGMSLLPHSEHGRNNATVFPIVCQIFLRCWTVSASYFDRVASSSPDASETCTTTVRFVPRRIRSMHWKEVSPTGYRQRQRTHCDHDDAASDDRTWSKTAK